jgi:hypothetical protein
MAGRPPLRGQKPALMKPLRSKAVEQSTLSSPLRMAARRPVAPKPVKAGKPGPTGQRHPTVPRHPLSRRKGG